MPSSPGRTLLRSLGYDVPDGLVCSKTERAFDVTGLSIEGGLETETYVLREGDRTWALETKVVLDAANLNTLAHLVARLAPPGSTARLQADGHVAGNVFVGLVLCYDEVRVPVQLVSGDIGCGLTLVPVVRRGQHMALRSSSSDSLESRESRESREFHSYVLKLMRQSLKRGKVAEQGLSDTAYLDTAAAFYGAELDPWLENMAYVLTSIGVFAGVAKATPAKTLAYVGKFCQSLGSSGNHFMELAADETDRYWFVVHSGSRALGAMVYGAIAEACRLTHDGFEIATGELARFYARAYDALNQFAKLNRVICAVACLDAMGCETSAAALKAAMVASPLFSHGADVDMADALMGGLTHNGLKAFVDDGRRLVMHVLSKGAVAVSRRASAVIVALRAGEGCVAFTLVDPTCPWREVTLEEARALAYAPVTDAGDGVVFAGHGAGRAQSTSETARRSTFEGMADFFRRVGIVANVAPGVLGDNPEMAYKKSAEILRHLPLNLARTQTMLRTLVSHKEGLSFNKAQVAACAKHICDTYTLDPLAPLWCDFNLVRGHIPEEVYADGCRRRDEVFAALEAKFSLSR